MICVQIIVYLFNQIVFLEVYLSIRRKRKHVSKIEVAEIIFCLSKKKTKKKHDTLKFSYEEIPAYVMCSRKQKWCMRDGHAKGSQNELVWKVGEPAHADRREIASWFAYSLKELVPKTPNMPVWEGFLCLAVFS